MSNQAPPQGLVDEVQTFDATEALKTGHFDMATSPNSHITVVRVPLRGDTQIQPEDSDQILVVLEGACRVDTPSGSHSLGVSQGVLIPPGTNCRFTNTSEDQLVLFSMETRRPSDLMSNRPSAVVVRIPVEYLDAKGIGNRIYAYTMDRLTIGISPHIMEEWNQVSTLRMNCKYRREGDQIVAMLPERIVGWYRLEGLTDGDYTLRTDRTKTRVRVNLSPYVERRLRG